VSDVTALITAIGGVLAAIIPAVALLIRAIAEYRDEEAKDLLIRFNDLSESLGISGMYPKDFTAAVRRYLRPKRHKKELGDDSP